MSSAGSLQPTQPLQMLQVLRDHASQERDRAATALRRCEEVLRRAQLQGSQLGDYRVEYTQRWSLQFGQRGAIEIVHCYHAFMQRLDEAIALQQRQVEAAAHELEGARQALLRAELRVASVGKLIERRMAELERQQWRREQRQSDEIALHLARRRAALQP